MSTTLYRYRELHPFGAPVIGAGYTSAAEAKDCASTHADYLMRRAETELPGAVETSAVIVERYWTDPRWYREPETVASFPIR